MRKLQMDGQKGHLLLAQPRKLVESAELQPIQLHKNDTTHHISRTLDMFRF
jgi:hypothetical protein